MKTTHLRCKNLVFLVLIFLIGRAFPVFSQKENLNVLDRWVEWSDSKNMLVHHLNSQAFSYLDKRDAEIAVLKTKEDWIARQQKVRETLMNLIGPFPEKTPLNPKVTGVVKKDGFRIEKIIYESIPGLYVTSALFIPEGRVKKRPAIIQVSGHGFSAFRSLGEQKRIYNLVRKGFIVFAIDPFGQGERIQYWDEKTKTSQMGDSPVAEHSYFGDQMFLSGISPIRYFIWDGIRGVDYLLTRKEVDPDRIGIFGCSGGGTQTTFISAFDERIKAAAPGCYITGFRRLLESIGPQDAEQNIYRGILNGITHADLLELRAPKPLIISSTTLDFFSIQGAIETYQEVKLAYKAFGKEENVSQVYDDEGHGFHKTIVDIYAFFQNVLELPGSPLEEDFEGFKPEDLQVTVTGQLSTSTGGELAFDISKKEAQKLINKINDSRKNTELHLQNVLEKAKEISGYISPSEEIKSVFRGRYHREGYSIEMYALQGEGKYVIPLLLFVPDTEGKKNTLIYLHPDGKINDAAPGGKIEELVKKGYIVAAPDVIGRGEVEDSRYGTDYLALLIGRSVAGVQAGDVNRVVEFLKTKPDVDKNKIFSVAFDEMCPVLLHAAVFNNSINSVTLVGSPVSYGLFATNKLYNKQFLKNFIAGILTAYDLPDLIGSLAPRKIALIELRDQMQQIADKELLDNELSFPKLVFSQKNVPENIKIVTDIGQLNSVIDWCAVK